MKRILQTTNINKHVRNPEYRDMVMKLKNRMNKETLFGIFCHVNIDDHVTEDGAKEYVVRIWSYASVVVEEHRPECIRSIDWHIEYEKVHLVDMKTLNNELWNITLFDDLDAQYLHNLKEHKITIEEPSIIPRKCVNIDLYPIEYAIFNRTTDNDIDRDEVD